MSGQKSTHVSDAEEFSKKNSSASETKKTETHVSEEKKKIVAELAELLKSKSTILIASIKNLPASQFQEIGKKLRGKALVKVPKKNLMLRAIEDTKKPELKKLEEAIHADVAVLFSDLDSFELAGDLLNNKTPAKAKPGQEAPEDIEIKAGMTELPPGPAISELGAVGLKTKVTDGKLEIMENRVIVKKGEAISQKAADIMSKLDIKPFSIGFIPLSSYDVKENKFYAEFSIDREGTLESLKDAYGRALPFAVEIGYATSETIGFLLGKAQRSAMALEKFETVEAPVEEKKEEEAPKEEVKEESSEEKKEDATAEESKEEKAAESEEAPKGVPPKSDEGGKVKEDQTPDEETKSEGEEK